MPAAARLNDLTAGHGGFPPVPIIQGSPNVRINGRAAARVGDAVESHSDGHDTHQGAISGGSARVFINGRHAARVGDPVSCGDSIAQGSPNVTIGEGGDGSAAIEASFEAQKRRILRSDDCTEEDRLILCLPDIAEAEASRAANAADAQGWQYLSDMLKKWIGTKENVDPEESSITPFFVSLDWTLNWNLPRSIFSDLCSSSANTEALFSLAHTLEQQGKFQNHAVTFDFIDIDPHDIRELHHQTRSVTGLESALSSNHGLYAALGGYTYRALAKGNVTPCASGGYDISIENMAVVIHDVFNFEGFEYLGSWDCHDKTVSIIGTNTLTNADFRSFASRHKTGGNFLVVSEPHILQEYTPSFFHYETGQ